MKTLVTLPLFVLVFGWAQGAASAQARSAEQIRDCSRANLPEQTMVQNIEMEAVDESGNSQRSRSRFFLKRYSDDDTRATLQVRAPLDLDGVSYLMVDREAGDQLYLYLPAVGRVRRVSGKQGGEGMLGTDFSYEDIKQLRAVSAGGTVERLEDGQLQARDVYNLALTPPADEGSAYARIVFAVDQQTCVALQADFFEPDGRQVKRLEAEAQSLQQIEGRWLARDLKMTNLGRGTHTRMTLLDVELDNRLSNSIFNPSSFYLAATVGAIFSPLADG